MSDITKMTKTEIIDYLRTIDKKAAKIASTNDIENSFINNGIEVCCPECGCLEKVKNGKNNSGSQRYKCRSCGITYTPTINTIFEGTDFTWKEMVDIVFYVITRQPINFICRNIRNSRINNYNIWLIQHKILKLLAMMPKPILTDVIQIDEKYIREAQKGSRDMYSLLGGNNIRKRRKHCYRSECGIFGPEFMNILCAVDNRGHFYAKCVCLVPMGFEELEDLKQHIFDPSYICTDNLELYSEWCKQNKWKHYVEPSTYRKERKARGYVNTDNPNRELTQEEYELDKKINMELYKIGKYPHIEGSEHKLSYDEFIALRYKFGLSINRVNSFHGYIEENIITNKRNVAIEYLSDYIEAYTYLLNYRSERNISSFSKKDAENILIKLCRMTKGMKHSPTNAEIKSQSIDHLPRPTTKVINQARKKMEKMRVLVDFTHEDEKDQSAYEGDESAQFVFNKRKFLNSIGTIRLNELAKNFGIYKQGMTKRQKIDELSKLSNIDDIIFYEIYLHRYGSDKAFADAVDKIKLPEKKKRKRKNKKAEEKSFYL